MRLKETTKYDSILFITHHYYHPRNQNLATSLGKKYNVLFPSGAEDSSSTLSLSLKSISSLLRLGLAGRNNDIPKHIDNIDVFASPMWKRGRFVLDYHVPLVPELKWLKLNNLAGFVQFLMPRLVESAKVVIAPNQRMLDHAARYAKIKRRYVIPNYPSKKFHRNINSAAARNRLGIPENQIVALSVLAGRMREIYGADLLFKTWKKVIRKFDQAHLYLLGDTKWLGYDSRLLRQIQSNKVHFVGRVPHNEVPYWIAASDICLSQRTPGFPSEYYDIYDSLKLSEYALFEKPIVAAGYSECSDYLCAKTNVESFSNAIKQAINGYAPSPVPHTWEENEKKIHEAYSMVF